MKTIIFYHPSYALPTPAIGGGAVEELNGILIDENEKSELYNFIIFQPKPTDDQLDQLKKYSYKHTKLEFYKNKKSYLTKIINKIFRITKMPFRLCTYADRCFLSLLKKNSNVAVVFEGYAPDSLLNKASKICGKENLYLHLHSNFGGDKLYSKYLGNVIGVSNFVLNQVKEYYEKRQLECPKRYLLLNCVRDEKFHIALSTEERIKLRQKLGFEKDNFIVVFCGRIVPEKGTLELMRAVCNIKNENIKLLIIGSPNFSRITQSKYLSEVENLTKNRRDKIVFSGYIPNEEVPKYYQVADLQVVPSLYNDPAPLVVIEGLKSGLPQICTQSGGVPEYIDTEGTIIIDRIKDVEKDLKQEIEKLSINKKKLQDMKQKNIIQGKKYTCTKYYQDFTNIIGE